MKENQTYFKRLFFCSNKIGRTQGVCIHKFPSISTFRALLFSFWPMLDLLLFKPNYIYYIYMADVAVGKRFSILEGFYIWTFLTLNSLWSSSLLDFLVYFMYTANPHYIELFVNWKLRQLVHRMWNWIVYFEF